MRDAISDEPLISPSRCDAAREVEDLEKQRERRHHESRNQDLPQSLEKEQLLELPALLQGLYQVGQCSEHPRKDASAEQGHRQQAQEHEDDRQRVAVPEGEHGLANEIEHDVDQAEYLDLYDDVIVQVRPCDAPAQ
mmetsp:Transcript_4302/g.8758  ORF Transcript_4302/g.8758 Transcript_4302/m.8758 type:complete len:136 (-) Transcript_4302:1062-1469(-)